MLSCNGFYHAMNPCYGPCFLVATRHRAPSCRNSFYLAIWCFTNFFRFLAVLNPWHRYHVECRILSLVALLSRVNSYLLLLFLLLWTDTVFHVSEIKSSYHYVNFDTWQSESYLTPFHGSNYERLCMLRRESWTICFVKPCAGYHHSLHVKSWLIANLPHFSSSSICR